MGFAQTASAAEATTLPCSSQNLEGDVSGFSLDCQVLEANNDKAALLNDQNAFGFDDWTFGSKYEIDEANYETGVSGLGFAVDGGGDGGSFSVDDGLWSQWSSAVILFKSASIRARGDRVHGKDDRTREGSDGSVVMFLIQPGETMGDFARSTSHAISHISLYLSNSGSVARNGTFDQPLPTPLPAPALMLSAGLAGFGVIGLRRGRKA